MQEVVAKVTGNSRPAPQGMWVQGGGIEIPCKYFIFGKKEDKAHVRNVFTKNK